MTSSTDSTQSLANSAMTTPLDIVILAAGQGTRMRSDRHKVLHELAGKPLLGHVLDATAPLYTSDKTTPKTLIVYGHNGEQLQQAFNDPQYHWVEQATQQGTGHAVIQALPLLQDNSVVLIVYGDVPLLQTSTLQSMINQTSDQQMVLLTVTMDDATGYGRIVRNHNDYITAIVEHRDADSEQQQIKEINTGIMAVRTNQLQKWLPQLSNNNSQREYYLTDIIAMAVADNIKVQSIKPEFQWEVEGINDRLQLAKLERCYQQNIIEKLVLQGLGVSDPQRLDIRGNLEFGRDCQIDVNVIFNGQVKLGDRVSIGPNCCISNATIGNDVRIEANTVIDDAVLEDHVQVGPFARLRPGTQMSANSKVGNFVETKNAQIGERSKINHLSYVGDAELGTDVNVGAGVITCNYDGANKHKTTIDDGAFIGSNSALIAPVDIGKNATVGAGSAISTDIDADSLGLTRAQQKQIHGWQRPTKKQSKK